MAACFMTSNVEEEAFWMLLETCMYMHSGARKEVMIDFFGQSIDMIVSVYARISIT